MLKVLFCCNIVKLLNLQAQLSTEETLSKPSE